MTAGGRRSYDVPSRTALDGNYDDATVAIGSDLVLVVSPISAEHAEDAATTIYACDGDGNTLAKLAEVSGALRGTLNAVLAQAANTARMLWPDHVVTSKGRPQ